MQTFPDRRAATPHQKMVESTNRARQGVTGHNVRYVLGVSLTAAIAALALVYVVFFMMR